MSIMIYILKWRNFLKVTEKLFIEWAEYASRADSLANAINAKTVFIGKVNKHRNILISLFSYPSKIWSNIKVINKNKPRVVYITNTHWIIAALNLILSKIYKHKLIFDSHSCAFDHEFFKYPLFLSLYFAKLADLSIVTNENHLGLLEKNNAKAIIISDIPFEDQLLTDKKINLSDKFNLLYICTFAPDEPYQEVIEAAKVSNNINIYITGKYERVDINPEDYPHVNFTGFLSNQDYKTFLNNVDGIMTLTTRSDTMQRAGSEAISVGKPLITSNTKMLNKYFYQGTVFVENNAESIRLGFEKMFENYSNLESEIKNLRDIRKNNFNTILESLNKIEGNK